MASKEEYRAQWHRCTQNYVHCYIITTSFDDIITCIHSLLEGYKWSCHSSDPHRTPRLLPELHYHRMPQLLCEESMEMVYIVGEFNFSYILGMHTRIFCLAPTSQCVNSPTEAARARALLTVREARLPTNDGS